MKPTLLTILRSLLFLQIVFEPSLSDTVQSRDDGVSVQRSQDVEIKSFPRNKAKQVSLDVLSIFVCW